MGPLTTTIIILSSVGFVLSIIFGAFLLGYKRGNRTANLLLGLLLLALALRIGKSVFYHFTDLPLYIKNLGLGGHYAIGPLLYLYGRALLVGPFRFRSTQVLHFAPALLYLGFGSLIPNEQGTTGWYVGYGLVLVHVFAYLLVCFYRFVYRADMPSAGSVAAIRYSWYRLLTLGLFVVWVVYLSIFIEVVPDYLVGALSFSLFVVLLVFIGLNQPVIFSAAAKYKDSSLTRQDVEHHLDRIRTLVERERLFMDANLTVSDVAARLVLTPRTISQVINEGTAANFSSFINAYRIEAVKARLRDPKHQHLTISAIAYDCGFNALSTFNTAFKTQVGVTPSAYRRAHTARQETT